MCSCTPSLHSPANCQTCHVTCQPSGFALVLLNMSLETNACLLHMAVTEAACKLKYASTSAYQNDDSVLFVAGESYAGVYVPTLAQAVLQGNNAGQKPYINLQVKPLSDCLKYVVKA